MIEDRKMLRSFPSVLSGSAIYGLLAFVAGFAFGALRQLVLIPQFGERTGYWIEFPMVTGTVCTLGWWLGRKHAGSTLGAIGIGLGGTAGLLALESIFALGFSGMSPKAYLAQFDIMSGALFPFGLAMMILAPIIAYMRQDRR